MPNGEKRFENLKEGSESGAKAFAFHSRSELWPRALARDWGSEPAFSADEAGSQPVGSGGVTCFLSSERLLGLTVLRRASRDHSRRSAVNSDECSVPPLRQKLRVDERIQ